MISNIMKYYKECLKFDSLLETSIKNEEIISDIKYLEKTFDEEDDTAIGYIIFTIRNKRFPLFIFNSKNIYFNKNLQKVISDDEFLVFEYEFTSFFSNFYQLENLNEQIENIKKFINKVEVSNLFQKQVLDYRFSILKIDNAKSNSTKNVQDCLSELINSNNYNNLLKNIFSVGVQINDNNNTNNYNNIYLIDDSNLEQNIAIKNTASEASIIKGPPGTGKTKTILNIIATAIINGESLVITSKNNLAVDNIIDDFNELFPDNKFAKIIQIMRLGSKTKNTGYIKGIKEFFYKIIKEKTSIEVKNIDEIKKQSQDYYNQMLEVEKNILSASRFQQNYLELKREYDELISLCGNDEIIELNNIDLQYLYEIDRIQKSRVLLLFEYGKLITKISFNNIKFKKLLFKMYLKLSKIPIDLIDYLLENVTFLELVNSLEKIRNQIKIAIILDKMKNLKQYDLKEQMNKYNELMKLKKTIDQEIFIEKLKEKVFSLTTDEVDKIDRYLDMIEKEDYESISIDDHTCFIKLFPVVFISILSVKYSCPKGWNYDLAIVDEGSQCDIPSLAPLCVAAKRLVVIGDNKQLNHITCINNKTEKILSDRYLSSLNLIQKNTINYVKNSAFDFLCERLLYNSSKVVLLKKHYRCDKKIIQFCNQYYYDNQLEIVKGETNDAIIINEVNGTAKDNKNIEEAKRIIEFIKSINIEHKNIGIITPYRNQSNLIAQYLKENNLNEIKNETIHKFQGQGYDVIIMSTVIDNNVYSYQYNFVCSDSKMINVAVSRAKKQFILFTNPEAITKRDSDLSNLIKYINQEGLTTNTGRGIINIFSEGNSIKLKNLLSENEEIVKKEIEELLKNTNFFVEIKMGLKDVINIKDRRKFDYSMYYLMAHLDFVIYDKDTKIPVCAIESDDFSHKYKSSIEKDKKKNTFCNLCSNFKLFRVSFDKKKLEESKKNLELLKIEVIDYLKTK